MFRKGKDRHMTDFRYGPVELYLVGYDGEGPDATTFRALADLIDAGIVRLLDLVIVSKDAAGTIDVIEVEDLDAFGFGAYEPAASGLAGVEDIEAVAEAMPPSTAAALLVVELVYARALAQSVADSGGVVLRTERIPAPIVNAVADFAEAAELESQVGA
jgi:uncharacterized membrane protein